MKKIYLLVLKSYLGPLVMTFFIALFILLMQFLWKYIDELVGKGLEWYIVVELLFYASATFVPMALPLAILLSSLMTMGNLGENYELVAMKAAGISLRRIMTPLIITSIITSFVAFYFSNNIYPIANLKFKSLLFDVREQKLALDIKEGIFYSDLNGFVIRINEKENDDKTIRDIMIYDHRDKKGNVSLTVADSGIMELTPDGMNLIFTLYSGSNYLENITQRNYRETRPFQRRTFREDILKFSLEDFAMSRTDEDLFSSNYSMLNLTQLRTAEDSLIGNLQLTKKEIPISMLRNFTIFSKYDSIGHANYTTEKTYVTDLLEGKKKYEKLEIIGDAANRSRRARENMKFYQNNLENKNKLIFKHQVEWHRKFTLSVACFVLFFIGAPLGAIIRKGGLGLPVVFSVLFFVLFHIISITGEKSVKSGVLDANVGMWIAPFVLLPLGIFLSWKATTDAPLLDSEAWGKYFGKFLKRKSD